MRMVTFEVSTAAGRTRKLGALVDSASGERVIDLTASHAMQLAQETKEPTPREYAGLRTPPDMIGWLRAGAIGKECAEAALAFALRHPGQSGLDGETLTYDRKDVRLLAPLPRPTSFRDFSTYLEHMSRSKKRPVDADAGGNGKNEQWYRTPPYCKGSCAAIRGPEDPVPWPYYTEMLDLELEIGIIVGREGRNLTPEQARDHIAGYTILVDSSCRDGYGREPFGPAKRKDFHTAIGPCMVTSDSVDPENMKVKLEVDGELWFEGSTAAPHSFSPADIVAYASDSESIYPGDLLGTGTVSLCCSMDLHKWIKLDQVATFTVEGIGTMSLKVVKGDDVVSHVTGMTGRLRYSGAT